jgi:prophage tail gpP-like protein
MNEDRVQLSIASGPTRERGRRLNTWTEYEVEENLFKAANDFSFKLSLSGAGEDVPPEEYIERVCALTLPDAVFKLELDGVLLGTGIIVDQYIGESDEGEAMIEIQGMDPAMLLLSNEVDPKLQISSDTTLPDIADKLLQQYRGKGISLDVVADDIANRTLLTGRLIFSSKTVSTSRGPAAVKKGGANEFFIKQTLADAQPHPGETEWDFLHRHAENIGVIPYFMADGNLCFIAPDYDQEELFKFQRLRNTSNNNPDKTNILRGGRRRSMANAATSVEVLGRGSLYRSADPRVTKARKTKKKPAIRGTATTDLPFTWPRRRYLRDTNPSNNDEAKRVANRELAHRNANAVVYEYVVAGHRDKRNYAYTVNTMAHIRDELPRPTDDLAAFITRRVLRKSRAAQNGTLTELTLVPKGAIVL